MNEFNLSMALHEHRYETLGELIDAIDRDGGRGLVSMIIHDGMASDLYLPNEIELFNDEILSRTIIDASVSDMKRNYSAIPILLHVTI